MIAFIEFLAYAFTYTFFYALDLLAMAVAWVCAAAVVCGGCWFAYKFLEWSLT